MARVDCELHPSADREIARAVGARHVGDMNEQVCGSDWEIAPHESESSRCVPTDDVAGDGHWLFLFRHARTLGQTTP
jgi:hypothetical protein